MVSGIHISKPVDGKWLDALNLHTRETRTQMFICRQSAGVDQIPLRVNSGQFNITASMFLAPYAELSVQICTSIVLVKIGRAHV